MERETLLTVTVKLLLILPLPLFSLKQSSQSALDDGFIASAAFRIESPQRRLVMKRTRGNSERFTYICNLLRQTDFQLVALADVPERLFTCDQFALPPTSGVLCSSSSWADEDKRARCAFLSLSLSLSVSDGCLPLARDHVFCERVRDSLAPGAGSSSGC